MVYSSKEKLRPREGHRYEDGPKQGDPQSVGEESQN